MYNYLIDFLGLWQARWNRHMPTLQDLHGAYITRAVWIITALLLVMVGLNYINLRGANLVISLFLGLIVITVATRPEPLIATAVAGITTGLITAGTVRCEIEGAMRLYIKTIGDIILWVSIFGMFLGTVSCRNNPGAVLLVAVSLIVIGYGSWRWNMGPTIYKRVIYTYACGAFILSVLSLVPAHIWIHWTGHDLGSAFHVSKTERALAAVEATQDQTEDATNAKMLQSIEAKVATGQKLTKQEEAFLATAKALRENNSLPSLTKAKLAEVKTKLAEFKPAPPAPTPPPVAKTGKVVVPVASAPITVGATPTPPATPAVVSPASETWTIRFSRDGAMWESRLSVTKNGSHITMRAVDGTTYEGDFMGGCYRGDILLNGRPNGMFFVSFSANEGSGEWIDNRRVAFKMWRIG